MKNEIFGIDMQNLSFCFEETVLLVTLDHEYRMVAQSCDHRTLVGLARISDVDERLFLTPPAMQESEVC